MPTWGKGRQARIQDSATATVWALASGSFRGRLSNTLPTTKALSAVAPALSSRSYAPASEPWVNGNDHNKPPLQGNGINSRAPSHEAQRVLRARARAIPLLHRQRALRKKVRAPKSWWWCRAFKLAQPALTRHQAENLLAAAAARLRWMDCISGTASRHRRIGTRVDRSMADLDGSRKPSRCPRKASGS